MSDTVNVLLALPTGASQRKWLAAHPDTLDERLTSSLKAHADQLMRSDVQACLRVVALMDEIGQLTGNLRDLALARRKRGISTSDMAARLFVGRNTLWRLERGDPTVALGTLATAAFVLNLHDRLANLAAPASDELALSLDERRLPKRIRAKVHEHRSPH